MFAQLKNLATASVIGALGAVASADLVMETQMDAGTGKTTKVIMKVRGTMARSDAHGPAGPVTAYVDLETGVMISLVHQAKKGLRMNFRLAEEKVRLEAQKAGKPIVDEPLNFTGERERVGPWDCEVYSANRGGFDVRVWIA